MIMKPNRPLFIAFEGLDGTGKTSCARRTAELLGAHFMTTPPESMRACRDRVLASLADSQEAAQLFYLATVVAAAREVEGRMAAGMSVVLDRYLLSTQVYAEFRGSTLPLPETIERLIRPADITLYLEASREVRFERTQRRAHATSADQETFGSEADQRLREGYRRWLAHPVVGQLITLDSQSAACDSLAREVVRIAIAHADQASKRTVVA